MPRKLTTVGIIIAAAGSGSRLGRGKPKALEVLQQHTILEHALNSLAPFAKNVPLVRICITAPAAHVHEIELIATRAQPGLPITVITGGHSRQASIEVAVRQLQRETHPPDVVLVHDAARCLAPSSLFHRVYQELVSGAPVVVPTLPVVDTLLESVSESGVIPSETVVKPVDRTRFARVQTPQGFSFQALVQAHTQAASPHPEQNPVPPQPQSDAVRANQSQPPSSQGASDDATLAYAAGFAITTVPGSESALKITTEPDLLLAERLLSNAAAY